MGDSGNGLAFITFSEATRRLPTINGTHLTGHTVARWERDGVKVGQDVVKLRSARIGSMHVTTDDWLAEFLEAAGR